MKTLKYIFTLLLCTFVAMGVFSQEKDSLNIFLEMAGKNNPSLNAKFLAYKASLEKIPQAGAYKDPELSIGFFLKPMQMVNGKQIANVTLMQMFPWFGTRKTAQNEMTHMAQMAFEDFRETRDNLFFEIYSQWYLLCNLQQRLINNIENKKLLTQLEQLSIRKLSSPSSSASSSSSMSMGGSPMSNNNSMQSSGGMNMGGMAGMASMGSNNKSSSKTSSNTPSMSMSGGMASMSGTSQGMSDVLRIQLEIAEIDNAIENLEDEIKVEKIKFNTLLNRPIDIDIQIPETFEQTPFMFDIESIKSELKEKNPMLAMINEEILASQAKGEMDKKMSYPMFGIGLQYMMMTSNDEHASHGSNMGSMGSMNMIMPMFSISVPIFRHKYNAQKRENKLYEQSYKEKYTDALNGMEAELHKTKQLLDNASRKIALYNKQTELAQSTYNLILKEFATGKSDLSSVIQIQRQLLDYQLKKAEAIVNYNTTVASIQRLISFNNEEK